LGDDDDFENMNLLELAEKSGGFKNALENIKKEGGSPEQQIQDLFYSPLFDLIGLKVLKAENGNCELGFQLTKEGARLGGMIHGGITMYALDNATSMSVMTANTGVSQATLELKVNFVAPLSKEPFKALGHVVKVGRSTAVARGEVLDGDGKVCAAALGTWFLIQKK
jgi:uncharacterized protein (TIGR00369 family)